MKIAIGVPTYNGAARANELFQSILLRTSLAKVEVVLVDDGSPRVEETRALARAWESRLPLKYVEHGVNRGISAAWNTATRNSEADIVVLANDDVIVPSGDWLSAIAHPLKHSPQVGGVGVNWHAFLSSDVSRLLIDDREVTPRDPVSKALAPERRNYEQGPPGRVMCPTGQLFAFRRADYDSIGGFDDGYVSFFEESDFFTSMAAAGKISIQLNYPMCWHRWSATFGSNPELNASARMDASRRRYIEKWKVPPEFQGNPPYCPFDYTNPKYLGAIGDVEVEYLKRDRSVGRGILHRSGAWSDR